MNTQTSVMKVYPPWVTVPFFVGNADVVNDGVSDDGGETAPRDVGGDVVPKLHNRHAAKEAAELRAAAAVERREKTGGEVRSLY